MGGKYKRFRSPEGKDFYGKTEKDVKAKYAAWKEKNEGIDYTNSKLTLNELAEEWLRSKQKHIKASTYDGYEYFVYGILKKNTGFDLGNMQLLNIQEDDVQSYVDSWTSFLPKTPIQHPADPG